jgi:hypothetical protein
MLVCCVEYYLLKEGYTSVCETRAYSLETCVCSNVMPPVRLY